jgi:hypothetical protein
MNFTQEKLPKDWASPFFSTWVWQKWGWTSKLQLRKKSKLQFGLDKIISNRIILIDRFAKS